MRKFIMHSNSGGFTLVELLIAMAMFSFVLLFVLTTFIQVNQAYVFGLTTKQVHEEARVSLEQLGRDLRVASSGNRVFMECFGGDCENENLATRSICFDNTAYIHERPQAESNGQFRRAEGVNCEDGDSLSGEGESILSDEVQAQFFKVTEVSESRVYKLELAVSAASFSNDLLAELGPGEGPRDISCDPSQAGRQFCRVVLVSKVISIRNDF